MISNVDHPEIITAIEWCAGYGGLCLGVGRVVPNLRVIALSEIEAYACANLVAKMEAGLLDPAPVWTNLKTFPCERFRDLVDILMAGYPCQPFSSVGQRKGAGDPRHLWPFILRAIGIIRPRRVFFENVEGHVSLGLSTVLSDLEEAGYRYEAGIFSAREIGSSHQRKRVFILGELANAPWRGQGFDPNRERKPIEGRSGIEPDGDQLAHPEHHAGSAQQRPKPGRREDAAPPQDAGAGQCGAGLGMADTCGSTVRPGTERTGRPAGTDADRRGEGAGVADSRCSERRSPAEGRHESNGNHTGRSETTGWIKQCGRETLADTQSGGLGMLRQPPGSAGQPDGGDEAVGHSASTHGGTGLYQSDPIKYGDSFGCSSAPPGVGLADASHGGTQQRREQRAPLHRDWLRPQAHGSTGQLRDPRLPKHPPAPGDIEGWHRVLEIDPTLEPAICRLAHGRPSRVDELRLAGNGVHPDTAELAYRTLSERLSGFE